MKPRPGSAPGEVIMVCMYKDEPGFYFDVNGEPFSKDEAENERIAAEAGFDVQQGRRDRIFRERMAEARQRIQEELEEAEREIAVEADEAAEARADRPPPFVKRTAGGDPRETEHHKIDYDKRSKEWSLVDKESGHVIADGLEKEAAEAALLETVGLTPQSAPPAQKTGDPLKLYGNR